TRCQARARQSAPFVGRDTVYTRAADPYVLSLPLGGIRKGDVPGLVGWERDLAIAGTAGLPAIRPHVARPPSLDSRRAGLVHHHYRNGILRGHVDPAAAGILAGGNYLPASRHRALPGTPALRTDHDPALRIGVRIRRLAGCANSGHGRRDVAETQPG